MMKSQAAMEYLMTYGWAILVIAVVLAALYSLGIFNPNTFAPKASAGSCEVVRPFGPGTTTDISLEGTCTNMLPKYVATFNGKNSVITVQNTISTSLPLGAAPRTIIAWFKDKSPSIKAHLFAYGCGGGNCGCLKYFTIYISYSPTRNPNINAMMNAYCTNQVVPITINPNQWYFIAYEYNGTNQIGYIGKGGTLTKASGVDTYNTISTPFYIGCEGYDNSGICDTEFWNGSIANVQIYNKALSANQISALYQEGIGGDPINPNHLVAWYPLNGNANDYSGNKYNGKAVNVGYSSTWYKTYSAP